MTKTILAPGTWVKKVGGDYEAIAQIVGEPMVFDNGVVRYNIAIKQITKGRLIHVANPKALVPLAAPQVGTIKPVQAWAVVDKDGKFSVEDLRDKTTRKRAMRGAEFYDVICQHRAPHRVVRVEIREIKG